MKLSIIALILTLQWTTNCGAGFFTATTELISLMETHGHVTDSLRKYLEECNNILRLCHEEKHKLDILKKYLNMFEKEHEKMTLQKNDYVANPINAFSLIHHLTEELNVILQYSQLERHLERYRRPFPVLEDLEGAATAIWRLQITYNMSVTALANGKLRGTYSHGNKLFEEESSPLSTSALYAVGRVVFNNEDYTAAVSWLLEALHKYYRSDPDDTFVYDESYIIDGVRHAYLGVGDFKNAIKWTKKLIKMRPLETHLLENLTFYQTQLENNLLVTQISENPLTQELLYQSLCRGEIPVPEHKRKRFHCHYKFGPSPFLRLAPIKTEILHQEPDVYLFHDTISDAEIQHLQNRSRNLLKRAHVLQEHTNPDISSYRISKNAWITEHESPVVAQISRRVADFSDLDTSQAEDLQLGNYGIGGHYDPHFDAFPKSQSRPGQHRIATVMFYMSAVEQGGATVFMGLKLTVFPLKNAAIFWYNLLPSGEPDFRTKHGACPVIRGSKWVANKWLRDGGQEFIHPCELEYQDNSYLGSEDDKKFMLLELN